MLGKLTDSGGEEQNKEMECPFTGVSHTVTIVRDVSTPTLGSLLAIFLKMEYVVEVPDTTEPTSRVLQQNLTID